MNRGLDFVREGTSPNQWLQRLSLRRKRITKHRHGWSHVYAIAADGNHTLICLISSYASTTRLRSDCSIRNAVSALFAASMTFSTSTRLPAAKSSTARDASCWALLASLRLSSRTSLKFEPPPFAWPALDAPGRT